MNNTSLDKKEKNKAVIFLILSGLFLGSITLMNILGTSKFIDYSFEFLGYDIPFVIASVANNFQYRKYLWQFVKDNWTNICQKLKGGSFLFGRVISTSIKLLSSQIDLDDINKFISNNQKDFDSLTKTIEQAKETIVNKIDFKNRNLLNEFQEV